MTETDQVSHEIADPALEIHLIPGPGLLKSVYEMCLTARLESGQLNVERQISQPVVCRGLRLDASYRLDMVVGNLVVVKVKSVESLIPLHQAQLLSYLRLSGCRPGLLINFNVPHCGGFYHVLAIFEGDGVFAGAART